MLRSTAPASASKVWLDFCDFFNLFFLTVIWGFFRFIVALAKWRFVRFIGEQSKLAFSIITSVVSV